MIKSCFQLGIHAERKQALCALPKFSVIFQGLFSEGGGNTSNKKIGALNNPQIIIIEKDKGRLPKPNNLKILFSHVFFLNSAESRGDVM